MDIKQDDKQQDDDGAGEFMIPVNTEQQLKPFIQRYFVKYVRHYENNETHYALLHSNNLFLIGLTEQHPLIQAQEQIKEIKWDISGQNLLTSFVKGKKKHGGLTLNGSTNYVEITTISNKKYNIKGVVDGALLEVNNNVIEDPQIILSHCEERGFLFIVNPSRKFKFDQYLQKI